MSDVVVNGRFLGRAVTGVERYAGEITRRLDGRIRVCRPAGIILPHHRDRRPSALR